MFFQVPFYGFFDAGLERLLHLTVALARSMLPDPDVKGRSREHSTDGLADDGACSFAESSVLNHL